MYSIVKNVNVACITVHVVSRGKYFRNKYPYLIDEVMKTIVIGMDWIQNYFYKLYMFLTQFTK